MDSMDSMDYLPGLLILYVFNIAVIEFYFFTKSQNWILPFSFIEKWEQLARRGDPRIWWGLMLGLNYLGAANTFRYIGRTSDTGGHYYLYSTLFFLTTFCGLIDTLILLWKRQAHYWTQGWYTSMMLLYTWKSDIKGSFIFVHFLIQSVTYMNYLFQHRLNLKYLIWASALFQLGLVPFSSDYLTMGLCIGLAGSKFFLV
jgi:hypothetical protein